jgi:hypothetical protein
MRQDFKGYDGTEAGRERWYYNTVGVLHLDRCAFETGNAVCFHVFHAVEILTEEIIVWQDV